MTYGRGQAWAYIEEEGSTVIGYTVDDLLYAPTQYAYWDDFVDAAHHEARTEGHTFSRDELGRVLWDTWYAEYDDNFDEGDDPKLDKVYATWGEGRPLFSLGTH